MSSSSALLPARKKGKSVKFSSYAAATSAPSSGKVLFPLDNRKEHEEDSVLQDDLENDNAGEEWQQRDSAGHPSAASEDEADDAVMIDSASLLPPSSTLKADSRTGIKDNIADQGLRSFPALSAKDAQGKITTQSRRVTVRELHPFSSSL